MVGEMERVYTGTVYFSLRVAMNQKLPLKKNLSKKKKRQKNIAYVSWRSWDLSLEMI